MNPNKYLIWEYSSNNEKWFDATDLVEWLKPLETSWLVKFKDKDNAIHVSFRKIECLKNPKQVDFMAIEHKGVPQYKVKLCLLFGNKYKLFFENNYSLVADEKDIQIFRDELKDNPSAKGILNYYKSVVQNTAKTEEDHFLLSQFDNITNINSESILALYIKAKNGKSLCPLRKAIISPFGTNLSQLNAVKTAFDNRISIIEGPPGTGKTQTILNIIANAVAREYKVAVVSNNNSAIENIYEKLTKYGFDFLCALLGNKNNTETFFDHIDIAIPNLETNELTKPERIEQYSNKLPELFNKENKKNKLLENKKSIEFEHKHFLSEHQTFDFQKISFKTTKISKKNLINALIYLSETHKTKISFLRKFRLKRMIKCCWKFYSLPIEEQILLLQNQYFLVRIKDIEVEISTITSELKNQSFNDILNEYKKLSLISFKNSLKQFFSDKRKQSYEKNDYKLNFQKFVQDYPVILSSSYSLAQCTKNGFLFDYLIVDESSQVNMASAILSMRIAKNIVIVGDTKQLPQIDDKGFKGTNEMLLEKYQVDSRYSYYGHSIMSSILAVYKDSVPRTLLKEHYRCNPEIIGFCNKEFYENELIVFSNNKTTEKPLRLIKLVEGNHARKNPDGDGGFYSEREADEILNLINHGCPDDLGIITPYRAQVKTISNKLTNTDIEISTIHKFQGREKKNIIFSTVVNDSNDFVDDPNMINVAVSRAVNNFTIIASDKVVNGERGVLADLVNYIKYHTGFADIQEGKISSVFDILYSDYFQELENFMKKHPSNDFKSENIIKVILEEILSDSRFAHLKMSMHISLKDIFKDKFIPMDEIEYKYFSNPWTHADFVIYNKYSNIPFAIIEVDGVSFHEQKQKQRERDALKNLIIKKSGIRFIRLKTNESNERERIISLLS